MQRSVVIPGRVPASVIVEALLSQCTPNELDRIHEAAVAELVPYAVDANPELVDRMEALAREYGDSAQDVGQENIIIDTVNQVLIGGAILALFYRASDFVRGRMERAMRAAFLQGIRSVDPVLLDRALASAWSQVFTTEVLNSIGMTDSKAVTKIITDALNRGDSQSAIVKQVREFLKTTQMTSARAKSIAVTETNRALAWGSFHAHILKGATEKDWVTVGDERVCPICSANSSAGRIPIRAVFPSGEMVPPAHPMCRCYVDYYYPKTEAA